MRSDSSRQHYLKQKGQSFAYFRVSKEDSARINSGQFTLFDFISNCFSFSTAKKRVAAQVLAELKQKPASFKQIQESMGLKKSTLFMVVLALERAGLVEREGKNKPMRLSQGFSSVLGSYASWWGRWNEQ
ncbi:MAG: MarR family transcriptional regulator [Candidatus Micrarchaeota archaeon]